MTGLKVIYLIEVNMCITITLAQLNSITCAVPQGSILGPLLFLLYINDIANVSDILFSLLFADDTSVFLQGDQLDDIANKMNIELKNL